MWVLCDMKEQSRQKIGKFWMAKRREGQNGKKEVGKKDTHSKMAIFTVSGFLSRPI